MTNALHLRGIPSGLIPAEDGSMRLRLLPPSPEGFRRLAIVLSIATFLLMMGHWVRDEQKAEGGLIALESEHYMNQKQRCLDESAKFDVDACIEAAWQESGKTGQEIYRWHVENLPAWIMLSLFAGFCGFLTALCTRTVGWVALGFTKRT
jgi:hypothetical protein